MVVGTWIIAADLALMVVLFMFCIRALRLPNTFKHSKQLTELEVSLRTLIREAASTGATFNDELLTRKQELEGLLLELEQNGARLTSVKESSKSLLRDLTLMEGRSDEVQSQLFEKVQKAEKLLENLERKSVETVEEVEPPIPSFTGAVSFASPAKKTTNTEPEVVKPVREARIALEKLVERVEVESSQASGRAETDFIEIQDLPVFKEHNL